MEVARGNLTKNAQERQSPGALSWLEQNGSLTKLSGSSSAVERQLPKLDVTGSIPVSRSSRLVDSGGLLILQQSEFTWQCWLRMTRPSTGSGLFPGRPRRQRADPAAPAWARSQEVHSSLISPFCNLHSEIVAQVSLAFALPFLPQAGTANRPWQR